MAIKDIFLSLAIFSSHAILNATHCSIAQLLLVIWRSADTIEMNNTVTCLPVHRLVGENSHANHHNRV